MFEEKLAGSAPGATFVVSIIYRQNFTWQGEIHWLEGNRKRYFRSALELGHLISEAIDLTGGIGSKEEEQPFRSWK